MKDTSHHTSKKRLKSNDNRVESNVVLPLPPLSAQADAEREIYARFMRHLRNVPNSCLQIKVLSAIQFTADMLDIGDSLVAKTLVDCGLRAPRKAFPSDYLQFIDRALMRSGWEVGGPSASAAELKNHWDKIGEDKFAAVRGDMPIPSETVFVET
jgi:hypothetical protein